MALSCRLQWTLALAANRHGGIGIPMLKAPKGVNDLPSINSTLQLVFFCTCFLHLVTVCIIVLPVTVFSVCTFCTNGDNNNNNTDYQQQSVVSNSVAVIKPQYELHHAPSPKKEKKLGHFYFYNIFYFCWLILTVFFHHVYNQKWSAFVIKSTTSS